MTLLLGLVLFFQSQKDIKPAPQKPTTTKTAKTTAKAAEKRTITVTATAYSTSPSENGGYTITKTGHKLREGIIAVDPRVIPLGTILDIPGYGRAWALDTGGAIKGRRIDLCHASRGWCNRWGRRKVTVTIVGYKSPTKTKKK